MESKEEVLSDGSYELVNFDDYASETESLDAEGVDSGSKALSDASSYDLLCSDISDTLVLTEDERFYNTTVSQENAFDEEEEENEEKEQVDDEENMEFGNEINSDSEVQPVLVSANKGKKRDLMAMLSMSSNPDPFTPPAQLNSKHDLKVVAKNHIIRYLPAKALFKCRKVSKEWNQWISGPFCAHEQSQFFRKTSGFFRYSNNDISFVSLEKSAYGVPNPSLSFLPQQVSIESSSNGLLLCQAIDNEEVIYVCNPANTEWVSLPPSQSYHGRNPKFVLAFEPCLLNFEPRYRVICLFSLLDAEEQKFVYFDIYDSETKLWRLSEELCLGYDASEVESKSIFVNGVAYWETKDGGLLGFDLKNEIYSVQKLPFDTRGAGTLSNIRGEICYVKARYEAFWKSCELEIYGDGFMALKKSVNVPVDEREDVEIVDCEVLGNSCDDVMGLVMKGSWGQNRLYVYDVKEEKAQRVGVLDRFEKLFPYVNSLVSIRGSG